MRTFMIMNRQLFAVIIFCIKLASAYAQSEYTIDITHQQYSLKTGFLKMGTNTSPSGEALSYSNLYLIRNGKPWFPVMGEMHFSRCAEKDWEESIVKMKAAG